jgi:hypothetical protein
VITDNSALAVDRNCRFILESGTRRWAPRLGLAGWSVSIRVPIVERRQAKRTSSEGRFPGSNGGSFGSAKRSRLLHATVDRPVDQSRFKCAKMCLQSQFEYHEKMRVSDKALKYVTRAVPSMSVNRHFLGISDGATTMQSWPIDVISL